MTQTNRISTHGPEAVGQHLCTYKRCGKSFSTIQGLNMHVGRIHTKTINTSAEVASNGSKVERNGRTRGKLTKDQKLAIVQFLAEKRTQFPTKVAAFKAALDRACATGVVTANSTSVDRYFKKLKRKYTKRGEQPVLETLAECVLTGPGMRIEFSAALLPTVLHTIALSLGGKK